MGSERTHELKTWPGPFRAMWESRKRFELRHNDRDYRVGDALVLREWDPKTESYTGSHLTARVTYVLRGPAFGLPEELCVMSLDLLGWEGDMSSLKVVP